MQHDHVLKKWNINLLTPTPGSEGVCLQAKYLRPCCCIRDSLLFDMQHDIVLKKLNFDLLNARVGGGGVCRQNICYHVSTFRDSNKFDMQHDHPLNKLNYDILHFDN